MQKRKSSLAEDGGKERERGRRRINPITAGAVPVLLGQSQNGLSKSRDVAAQARVDDQRCRRLPAPVVSW